MRALEKSHDRHSPLARTERRVRETRGGGSSGWPTSAAVRIHASTTRRASHGRRASSQIPSLPRPRESISEPNTRYVTHPPPTHLSRTPSTGSVVDRRTRMRPSILTDMFWSVVNLIVAL